jgi:cystathionine beta-lyase
MNPLSIPDSLPREDSRTEYLAAFDRVTVEQMRQVRRIKWSLYQGSDVLPAWVADMDLPIAVPIQRRLEELVARGDIGYHQLPIPPDLRQAFIDQLARQGFEVSPKQVYSLVNVVQGLDLAVTLFSEPGDGILLLTPIYAPFHQAVDGTGRRRLDSEMKLVGEGAAARYEIDFDHLRSLAPHARMLLLCNPHNPTGRVYERAELEQLAALALEHDLLIVSDEIHSELTFDRRSHIAIATLSDEVARRTITITSATKAYNLAGLPCALAVFGDDSLKQPFRELPPHIVGHGGILGAEAATVAWTQGMEWMGALREYLELNRDHLVSRVRRDLTRADGRSVSIQSPEATYLSWLDCTALALDTDPRSFFFEHARVALSPGSDFGPPGASFARLNFGTSRQILDQLLDRMAEAVARLD